MANLPPEQACRHNPEEALAAAPLSDVLVQHLGAPRDGEAPVWKQRLDQTIEEARRRWPGVTLTPERYGKRLAELCLASGSNPYAALAQLELVDLYLATACTAADPKALVYFDRELLSRVPAYLAPLRLAPVQVEDLCMVLRERILLGSAAQEPRIVTYRGQAPLSSWLRVTAVRAALNQLRRKSEQALETHVEANLAAAIVKDRGPEDEYLLQRYADEFKEAIRAAFSELSESDRGTLRMYYLGGLNTPQIAKLHGVSNTTASRWVVDARERLTLAVQVQLQARLRIQYPEIQSIYRALRSRIDWSISVALKG